MSGSLLPECKRALCPFLFRGVLIWAMQGRELFIWVKSLIGRPYPPYEKERQWSWITVFRNTKSEIDMFSYADADLDAFWSGKGCSHALMKSVTLPFCKCFSLNTCYWLFCKNIVAGSTRHNADLQWITICIFGWEELGAPIYSTRALLRMPPIEQWHPALSLNRRFFLSPSLTLRSPSLLFLSHRLTKFHSFVPSYEVSRAVAAFNGSRD